MTVYLSDNLSISILLDTVHFTLSNWTMFAEKYTMNLSLEIRFSRVPRSVYSAYMNRYFECSALSMLVLFDTNHEYQSNVSGGTGIVNLWSSRIEGIELGTFHYDIYNRDYEL